MTIILPILLFAACLGLFTRRIAAVHWMAMGCLIMLVIAYHFLKR